MAQQSTHPPVPMDAEPRAAVAARLAPKLAELIRFRTVSRRERRLEDREQFTLHAQALARLFPHIAAAVEREPIGITGQLWLWRGAASNRPVVLMAHQDVVPVEEEAAWLHQPFAGTIADGRVWGRGALDDKGDLVCILEAADLLAATGFVPGQDVYFFFGDNEETAGDTAIATAALLQSRGVAPWLVLDEGGAVTTGAFPLVKAPVGVIGVSEKGLIDVVLQAHDAGGHASAPPSFGAVQRIARAITRLRRAPFPASLSEVTVEMIDRLAATAPAGARGPIGLLGRGGRATAWIVSRIGAEPAALVRTTVAATELAGSDGSNVLARRAAVTLNIRIAAGESVNCTLRRIKRIIRDGKITIDVLSASEPSPVSPHDCDQFRLLEACLATSHPAAVPVPYIMLAATDSRRFTGISENVYRFAPLGMDNSERAGIHGTNESVLVSELGNAVAFYTRLIRSL
ncbi:M20/M25/M40 family metallo-hydrolase [Paeniglutamicibacter cryotolerans]|uniref:Carboxypeptidase PM20D1 n=1 Tax=Paeniglutamicibacter cryotolerans TaxID=670079 RepID=A0A839QNT6_9MICC|nr:M20/M25/M40 family metallo-hydrolase [Paeniglutamicibacter cryotolerans]MBB2996444.1 carboxypeptidase PM20D1 [Paeniglutamicibacter cryotolerans]